jgi:hypothetical protein
VNLGLRPSNFEFIYEAPSLLKKDLLYFDQIHICSLNDTTVLDDLISMDPSYHDRMQREFEFLKKCGLLCTFNLTEMMDFTVKAMGYPKKNVFNQTDTTDFLGIMETFFKIPKPHVPDKYPGKKKMKNVIDSYIRQVNKTEAETTRISAHFLTRFSARDEAFPLLQNDSAVGADPFHEAKVLEVVLEKLPIPNENVDWQQIVEYRANPDTEGKFSGLRVWMQDIAREDYTKNELEERIEHLLYEYETHLQFHQLKYEYGTMKVLITTTLETLENLAKLKLGKIAKTLFSLQEKSYDLLEAEMKAPGKEVAYISKTAEAFK